ncbi:winged helix-turn-helix transcriptional regulator [Streptacidiphilus sp. 4-A2]|nr:winged helix-turn-helix transcriptional regulator [Streptacidiphilus sp. 4-A2]
MGYQLHSYGSEGRSGLTEAEEQLWKAQLTVSRLLLHQLDRDLQAQGISLNNYMLLSALAQAPDQRLRMQDLAAVTLQVKSRVSHQIGRMEAEGLVVREPHPKDGRGTNAVLTDYGWEMLRRVGPHHVRAVRSHLTGLLDPEQLAGMAEALTPIAERLTHLGGWN